MRGDSGPTDGGAGGSLRWALHSQQGRHHHPARLAGLQPAQPVLQGARPRQIRRADGRQATEFVLRGGQYD